MDVAVAVVAALVALWSLAKLLSRRAGRLPPGPPGLPLLGAAPLLARYGSPWAGLEVLRRRYGSLFSLSLGARQCVVVSAPDPLREVLVERWQDFANRPDFLRFHVIFRGDRNFSIALCDWSSKQKARRDIAFPYMHPRTQSLGTEKMGAYVQSEMWWLTSELRKTKGQEIEPRQLLLAACGNVFYQFLCSKRFEPNDSRFQHILTTYNKVFRELFQGFAIDFMPWLKPFYWAKLHWLQKQAHEISAVTAEIFTEHEKMGREPGSEPRDLVDVMLDAGDLSREEGEVIVEDLVGGHPVVANLWLWGLQLLAGHPGVQDRIRQEISDLGKTPGLQDRHAMPYLEATIYEVLRCVSSPIIPHVATRDTTIGEYSVPKDTMVMFNNPFINMDPELWDDPKAFKPERFLNADGRVSKPSYFVPFGVGRRNCLGDGLVRAILFLGFSTILREFQLELAGEAPELEPGDIVPRTEAKLRFRSSLPTDGPASRTL